MNFYNTTKIIEYSMFNFFYLQRKSHSRHCTTTSYRTVSHYVAIRNLDSTIQTVRSGVPLSNHSQNSLLDFIFNSLWIPFSIFLWKKPIFPHCFFCALNFFLENEVSFFYRLLEHTSQSERNIISYLASYNICR